LEKRPDSYSNGATLTESDTIIRQLPIEVTDGPTQLALTEAIMNLVATGEAPPTLRVYSWSEPVVIMGVGQSSSDLDLEVCRNNGFRVLRRIGGGTAVFHDQDEFSVDLIVPGEHPLAFSDVHAGYELFAKILSDAFAALGLSLHPVPVEQARTLNPSPELRPICFASVSPYEFEINGRKLNGLCQIRRRGVIAYQSAIYRRFKIDPLLDALHHECASVRAIRHCQLERSVTDLERAFKDDFNYEEFAASLGTSLTRRTGIEVFPGVVSSREQQETNHLVDEKYASNSWTLRR
jgi:lipoyl(octanoyl) transferase